jgi:hypothetical protein
MHFDEHIGVRRDDGAGGARWRPTMGVDVQVNVHLVLL